MASVLGYSNTRDALSRHIDHEDKLIHQISASGQNCNMIFINESGLYSLILSSKLKTAKKFKHWVTNEILPSIYKNGVYAITQDHISNHFYNEDKNTVVIHDGNKGNPNQTAISESGVDSLIFGSRLESIIKTNKCERSGTFNNLLKLVMKSGTVGIMYTNLIRGCSQPING